MAETAIVNTGLPMAERPVQVDDAAIIISGQPTAPNGHLAGDQVDLEESVTVVASASVSRVPSTLGGTKVVLAPVATSAAGPAIAEPQFITFRFHNIGFDKMHERLYGDRYHTPEMLLADLQRIVENAYHEGDPDTVSKADQMMNYARIMVDQASDAQFRSECERLAKREKDKAKQKAERKAKEREAENVQMSEAADVPAEGSSTSQIEPVGHTLKRVREDEEMDGNSKRARLDEGDLEDLHALTDANTLANGQMKSNNDISSGPSNINMQASPTTSSFSPLKGHSLSTTNGDHSASTSEHALHEEPVAVAESSEPLPTFFLPQGELERLGHFLRTNTSSLNIEELEQLRAACYDCIWRARKLWDKSGLVREMRELADDFIQEVEESKRED